MLYEKDPRIDAVDEVFDDNGTEVSPLDDDYEYAVNPLLWDKEKWRSYYFDNHIELWKQDIVPATAQKTTTVCFFDFCVGFSKRGFAKLLKESEECDNEKV